MLWRAINIRQVEVEADVVSENDGSRGSGADAKDDLVNFDSEIVKSGNIFCLDACIKRFVDKFGDSDSSEDAADSSDVLDLSYTYEISENIS